MSGQFNFGLDDVMEAESNGRTMARGVAGFLTLLFWMLSSLTTFMFFSSYASAIGMLAGPNAAPLVAGVIGVLCLDVGCLAWSHVRSRAATSAGQMSVAGVAAVVDVVLAIGTSVLYILLATSFDVGIRDAGGGLSEFGHLVNYAGTGVLTLALAVNFGAVFLWTNLGADTRKASNDTSMRAVVAAAAHRADSARVQMTLSRTLESIAQQLPAEADAMAERQRQIYLDGTMRSSSRPATVDATVQPSANGHGGGQSNFR